MTTTATDPRLLTLHPGDNVLVARAPIAAGETILVSGQQRVMAVALSLGHKIARGPIAAGAAIVKYGAVIGTATCDIAPGAHVHVHNVRSNHTATYSLDAARAGHDTGAAAGTGRSRGMSA